MIKVFNFVLEKIKSVLYFLNFNFAIIISACCFVNFFCLLDLIFTKYFYIEILLFALGVFFTYIQLKINPDLLIDKMDQEQEQAEAEEKRKRRAAAMLDWNITYEWAVLLGKDN